MAFSTQELQYLDGLVPSYYENGYKYYVAYTNTNTNSSSSSAQTGTPDMIVYFSKNEITTSGYGQFIVPAGSIKCSVVASDYYSGYGSSYYLGSRLLTTSVNSQTLDIPDYEHIFSNAVGTAESVALSPNPYGMEMKYNETLGASAFLIGVLLMFTVFIRIFMRG